MPRVVYEEFVNFPVSTTSTIHPGSGSACQARCSEFEKSNHYTALCMLYIQATVGDDQILSRLIAISRLRLNHPRTQVIKREKAGACSPFTPASRSRALLDRRAFFLLQGDPIVSDDVNVFTRLNS
jgi:hypothetical protein